MGIETYFHKTTICFHFSLRRICIWLPASFLKVLPTIPLLQWRLLLFYIWMGVAFFFSHSLLFNDKKKHKWPKKSTHFSLTFFHLNLNGLFLFFFSLPFLIRPQKKNTSDQRNQQTLLQFIIAMSVSFFFPIWMSVSFFFLPILNERFFFFSFSKFIITNTSADKKNTLLEE